MDLKLIAGDICKSGTGDIYLVLKTNRKKKATSVLMLASPKNRSDSVGHTFTESQNYWLLYKIGGPITELEKIIYGVKLGI